MTPEIIRIGGATVDPGTDRVRAANGTETELRRQSAEVLRVLLAHRGETVSKDALMTAVWGNIAVTEDSLVQCISDIRRALGESDRAALHTVARRGYRLEREGAIATPPRPAFARLALAAAVALIAVIGWTTIQRVRPTPSLATTPLATIEGPVVAVLPFEALGGGARWDRLARGLAEDIAADLARNSWLRVIGPTAATALVPNDDPVKAGQRLSARFVLAGGLLAEGDQLRVSTNLTDARTGSIVWSDRWTGPTADVLTMQDRVLTGIDGALSGVWSGSPARHTLARAKRLPTYNLDACELYLLGSEQKHKFTLESQNRADELLLRAVAIDPKFARAWAALALVEGMQSSYVTDAAALTASRAQQSIYAREATAADPEDPDALLQLHWLMTQEGNTVAAQRAIRRAVEIAPNNPDLIALAAWDGVSRSALGTDPLVWAERAIALNPAWPDWYAGALGTAAFALGDDARAIKSWKEGPQDNPECFLVTAAAEGLLGNHTAARDAAKKVRAMVPNFDLDIFLAYYLNPGLHARLREGAILAGLGDPSKAAAN